MIKWMLIACAALFALNSGDAMSKCQETHSYDTCHRALNR